jgi:hypothetical protein
MPYIYQNVRNFIHVNGRTSNLYEVLCLHFRLVCITECITGMPFAFYFSEIRNRILLNLVLRSTLKGFGSISFLCSSIIIIHSLV